MRLKNDQERKGFIESFRAWKKYTEYPELNLKVFEYRLPDDSRILAFDYGIGQARVYPSCEGLRSNVVVNPHRFIHVLPTKKIDTKSHSISFLVNILKQFKEI